ncbi:hypothetical protein KSP40_PGU011250 [Platanthera guangdongensis]|uniref:Plus3 domain-containing protein n=1 Tax=Platanthera guangdongensis TaxID=2320717 RepID=A0ABR2MAX8_9ASPA
MSTEPVNKDEQSEDYCFVCKDGGHLRICDHKDCTKSYHPDCVNKDPTFLDADETWTCGWHSCCICHKTSTFKCFCCPTSFCQKCVRKAEFGQVKETKGFCGECLRLAKLVENCADIDSDEEKIDFDDRNTWEFLFKDYWPIVKRKEGLTLENVRYADALLNRVDKCKDWSDPDASSEQLEEVSESDDNCDSEGHPLVALKWKSDTNGTTRKKLKLSKSKFVGWGSVDLLKFLSVLGEKTNEPLEKYDVYEIVRNYILSNDLIHLDKRGRKYASSDSALYCLVRRRKFKLSRLYTLLEKHFASSDCSLDELSSAEEGAFIRSRKRKKTPGFDSKVKQERHHHKELVLEPLKSSFAAITGNNIKTVYLKRSLVMELMEDPTIFESKVVGCFVRIKVDPKGFQGTPGKLYQLGRITAVKKVPQEYTLKETTTDVVLCISNMLMDIKISMLSDDDFEEEECTDLHQLAVTGLFQRPSIVELEKKISIVHEDIVKHAIKKELLKLDKLIERANEKGWRKEYPIY